VRPSGNEGKGRQDRKCDGCARYPCSPPEPAARTGEIAVQAVPLGYGAKRTAYVFRELLNDVRRALNVPRP